MRSFRLSFTVLALSTFAFAQNAEAQTDAIEAHFEGSHIVPDLLESFDPEAALVVNFDGVGDIAPGQKLTNQQSGPTPSLTIVPEDNDDKWDGKYTVFMVDADNVGYKNSSVTRHWMVNNVLIKDNKVTIDESSTVITKYAGPGPLPNSGRHRYTILIYAQPADFAAPAEPAPGSGVAPFEFNAYVSETKLGKAVAGNYFVVDAEGEPATPAVSTQAVNSATLEHHAASGSGSGSGAPSQTGNAPSPSQSAGGAGGSGSGGNGAVSQGFSALLLAGSSILAYLFI